MAAKVAKTKKSPKPFFRERKDFLSRVAGGYKGNYAGQMVAVLKIFERYNNDIDFLSKVKPPSFLKEGVFWLITKEGYKFLDKKYKEFNFKPEEYDKPIETSSKAGEDIYIKKPLTINEFLKDEC